VAVDARCQQSKQRLLQRQQHPGAVARRAVGRERAAMAQRGQAGERERQHLRALATRRVRDEADAACVVLEAWVVQRVG
jgi:hypothetical protein